MADKRGNSTNQAEAESSGPAEIKWRQARLRRATRAFPRATLREKHALLAH